MRMYMLIVFAIYGVASALAFVMYWWDKNAAVNGRRRVRERSLHLVELCGGWPGALLAQRTFRHKTRDRWFRTVFFAIIALHALGWGLLTWAAVS
jgi:uncharacterized membrane protein YsdA (DUF1294 family)